MTTVAILLAAGAGTRMDAPIPKAFLELGGRPMFVHSLDTMAASEMIDAVVLVVPREGEDRAAALVREIDPRIAPAAIVGGGATRQESVGRGLGAVPVQTDLVVCHDAARPLASAALFRSVLDALRPEGAHEDAERPDGAVPVIPSPDTVKRVLEGVVIETVPRTEIGLAQTPQGFRSWALRQAHARAVAHDEAEATDDAMLLEAAGFRVMAVDGELGNFKITTPEDLRRAERVLEEAGRATGGAVVDG
jgi:2-C-methyl-D-erythritol 4-phosphate cytidylyltransferase